MNSNGVIKPSTGRASLPMDKQQVQFRMYKQDFIDAMDEYLNGLTHRDMYDTLYSFWFDWLLEHKDVEFIEEFIRTKEL